MERSAHLDDLIALALSEDLGAGDVTSQATIPAGTRARATMLQKAPGVLYGLDVAEAVFLRCDPGAAVARHADEAVWHEESCAVLTVEGDAHALLAAERTALNFVSHLSGVATLTARCVHEVAGTGAQILDTRKTTPGMRRLEKAAVAAGGGVNHRFGLDDELLVKDNHIAVAGGVAAAITGAKAAYPALKMTVECDTVEQVREAIAAGATRLLLDNMSLPVLRAVVAEVAGAAELEASGGLAPGALREIAETGVNFISLGALTHSAPILDLSLDLEPLR